MEEDADGASIKETLANGDIVFLTSEELDEREALQHVRKAEAGATVLFVGTTRNEFKGDILDESLMRLPLTQFSCSYRKRSRPSGV
jgi:hypothetical protein